MWRNGRVNYRIWSGEDRYLFNDAIYRNDCIANFANESYQFYPRAGEGHGMSYMINNLPDSGFVGREPARRIASYNLESVYAF